MTQKVLKVGTSAAVTIPKKSLEELGLRIGDRVVVDVDKKRKAFVVQPSKKISKKEVRIAELTVNFIEKYRNDLESLARK